MSYKNVIHVLIFLDLNSGQFLTSTNIANNFQSDLRDSSQKISCHQLLNLHVFSNHSSMLEYELQLLTKLDVEKFQQFSYYLSKLSHQMDAILNEKICWNIFFSACLSASPAFSAEWNYENRDYWPYIPTSAITGNRCWGERQSPIDIDTSDVYDEVTAKDLAFHASYAAPVAGTITNSAYHTLKFELANCMTSTLTISGKLISYFLRNRHY